MAIAFVADRGAGTAAPGGGSSFSFSPTGTCAVGDTLILCVNAYTSVTGSSVVDTKGNIWTYDVHANFGHIWSCRVLVALTTSDTITVTFASGTSNVWYQLLEFSGIRLNATRLDQTATVGSTAGTTPSLSTAATTSADELVVSVAFCNANPGATTPGSGYTLKGPTLLNSNLSSASMAGARPPKGLALGSAPGGVTACSPLGARPRL